MKRKYELISLGEPLLRLSPPGFRQIRATASLDLRVVGSQLNVAANCARLGISAAFLTKLPDSPLGELVLDNCRAYGVDVSHILLIPGARMGATYVEFSVAPRVPQALYDRAGSAASTVCVGDFRWDELAAQATCLYTDGIFPGLSESCRESARAFVAAGRKHGCLTCFDLNYRAHLWTPEAACQAWSEILPEIDLLVTNRNVSEQVFGYQGTDDDLMRRYQDAFGCKTVCFTSRDMEGLQKGGWHSQALAEGKVYRGDDLTFDIVDRYGTGDAWFSGFLCGFLSNGVQYGLDLGNAVCALAHTVEGDVISFSRRDAESIMGGVVELSLKR